MTKMTINQLTAVAGHIVGEGMCVTADKPKAIARVRRLVGEHLGDEALADSILECDSAVDACKKIDVLKRKGHKALPQPHKEETMNTQTAEAPATETKKRGRTSSNVGKTLTALVEENPRRKGTHGHQSMKIIIDAGKKGIKYEDFITAGGRNNDLAWDAEKGRVKIV